MSPARFERAAFRLGGGRSILLSYGRIHKKTGLRQHRPETRNAKRYFYILIQAGVFVNSESAPARPLFARRSASVTAAGSRGQ